MKKNLQKGFSLLELLVVIGIISILLAIGFSSYTTVQKKTRDAKRRSDLKAIQQAAEQYYSVCGFEYPVNPLLGINCTAPSIAFLPTVPVDPRSGTPYICDTTLGNGCGTNRYYICATPEVESVICVSNQQ